ncbi:hypothetical protein [Flammeovirga sp. SJP92]|uniref:hypothetical protein n=1 Tax=Flammeovirga sp. SJP92 TaxID=1775430 RepID=UPI000787090C|nr:hypothetical protein [Flammeovirga sp. SJP92]KXX70929.1 hypothetical protein AVL50_11195 [Flammeovirga sp. SJP92]
MQALKKFGWKGGFFLVTIYLILFVILITSYITLHIFNSEHQGIKTLLKSTEIEEVKRLNNIKYTENYNFEDFPLPNNNSNREDSIDIENIKKISLMLKTLKNGAANENDSLLNNKIDSVTKVLEQFSRSYLINDYYRSIGIKTRFFPFEHKHIELNLSKRIFEAESYFFLKDSWVFLEIILCAMMGVICNSLYFMTEYIRQGKFNSNETVIYIVKLFYAPIVVLIIYLGAEQFLGQESGLIPTPSNTIVLSFILGFFSGRSIEILSRIKDALFPDNQKGNDSKQEDQSEEFYNSFLKLTDAGQERVINEYLRDNRKVDVLKKEHPEIEEMKVQHRNDKIDEPFCLTLYLNKKEESNIPNRIVFIDSKNVLYAFETKIIVDLQ